MIKLRIKSRDEDKFYIVLNLLKQKLDSKIYSIDILDIHSDETNIFFILKYYHPKYINKILISIKDLIEIIDFNIEYAFVYSLEEAYTDTDKETNRYIIYNNLKY